MQITPGFNISQLVCHGKVMYFVLGAAALYELGFLNFTQQFMKAINNMYEAAGYISRKAPRSEAAKDALGVALTKLEKASEFFVEIQDVKRLEKNLKGVRSAHGAVYYQDIDCLAKTAINCRILEKWLLSSDCRNISSSTVYSMANEAIIEHGFGLSTMKGHSFNKTMREYALQKLKFDADLIMKTTQTSFSQPLLYRKRYQEPLVSNITCTEVQAAVQEARKLIPEKEKFTVVSFGDRQDHTAEVKVLVEAVRILGAQPRKPNRSHWKQNSGYAPTIPANETHVDVILQFQENDIICVKTAFGAVLVVIVEDVPFINYLESRKVVTDKLSKIDGLKYEYERMNDWVPVSEADMMRDNANEVLCCNCAPSEPLNYYSITKKFAEHLDDWES